jgi:glucose-1-phosphate cytidylyltransferase
MKVVILCGGKGTRLREETEYRPKPMLPIGGRPILWHIMKIYATQGFKDFVLCLGYKGDMIKSYFQNYLWMTSDVTLQLGRKPSLRFHNHHEEEDWTVTLVETGEETMTAGRINRVRRFVENDEHFCITYGDGVGNIGLREELEFHRNHGKILTLAAVRPPGRFGELSLEEAGRVTEFNEKPQMEAGRINGGYLIASPRLFGYLGETDRIMFEQEPMKKLAREGELMGFRHEGFWQPMDTFQEFTYLNKLWNEGRAPWKTW